MGTSTACFREGEERVPCGWSSFGVNSTHTGRDPQGWPGTLQGFSGAFREARDFSGRLRDCSGRFRDQGRSGKSGTPRDSRGSGTAY